jgi:RNA polymerase sigma-70 factor (ECF subfamily)
MRDDLEQVYRELRSYAFAIAYRMLGSVSDAEDVVQEAFLRLGQGGNQELRSAKAFVATVTTRLAIDALRSARSQRESYFGPWLPEPLLDDDTGDVESAAETADSLSMAFLILLETLSPVERAVFLLHDVFGFDYPEIATVVEKTEPNCRQVASRARRRVHDEKPRFEASRGQRDRLARQFFAACQGQDLNGLVDLLAGDAVFYGDGGGKGTGLNRPIHGRDTIVAMLLAWFRQAERLGVRVEPAWFNGQPGATIHDAEGRLVNVMTLDILGGAVQAVRSVINPDKLAHLGPLSPLGRRTSSGDWSADGPGGPDED